MENIPKPITREDMYYNYLINGQGALPKPITRKEHYLYYLCMNGFGVGGSSGGGALNTEAAGTPVGEILAYMGNTPPENYLACDGTIYNIADYPYLASHFTDEFGTSNHFGGDGETTFAVPDLRGEFLRGTGANGHVNSGNGAGVGIHQNATTIPYMHGGSSTSIAVGGLNLNQPEYRDCDNLTTSDCRIINGDKQSSGLRILSYTSRPTNTSVLYCIKCRPTHFINIENIGI